MLPQACPLTTPWRILCIWENDMAGLASGTIVLWSGSIATIPAGWVLCDGTHGTPDLRNRFIVGAGDTYAVGANGGFASHGHTFTSDGHSHTILAGTDFAAGTLLSDQTSVDVDTGTTANSDGRPPFWALAFIMKT